MTATDDVMAIVERDRAYYDRSGGGLTLSGGEPLAQFGFARELLEAARNAGIHTCVETCGALPQKCFGELLPLVDVFLFDYKATDPVLHRELTGVDNRLIISNLHWLLEQGAQLVLRCPLVPGINDQPEHLRPLRRSPRANPCAAAHRDHGLSRSGKDQGRTNWRHNTDGLDPHRRRSRYITLVRELA
jgi:pyruvate-formate lyase-activating enzyme